MLAGGRVLNKCGKCPLTMLIYCGLVGSDLHGPTQTMVVLMQNQMDLSFSWPELEDRKILKNETPFEIKFKDDILN